MLSLTPKNCTWIQLRTDLALAPDDLQNKSLSRPLTAKKGYYVVQPSWYNEG